MKYKVIFIFLMSNNAEPLFMFVGYMYIYLKIISVAVCFCKHRFNTTQSYISVLSMTAY